MSEEREIEKLEIHLEQLGKQYRHESRASEDFYDQLRLRASQSKAKKASVIALVPGTLNQWVLGSGVAACFVMILAGMYALVGEVANYGAVRLQEGGIVITDSNGTAGSSIHIGSTIETNKESSSLISLDGGRVHLFADSNTAVSIVDEETISIERGAVWVSIQENSGRFVVDTTSGSIVATGTSFAVRDLGTVEAFLSTGVVTVETRETSTKIVPGDLAQLDETSVTVDHLPEDQEPEWIGHLYRNYTQYYHRAYYRSVPSAN